MKTRAIVAFLSLLTGCAAILSVPDLTFDPEAGGGQPDAQVQSPGPTPDGGTTLDGAPAPPCDESKLQTDTSHCGRCNHDCLGGACNAGVCQPVVVGGNLTNPTALVYDANHLYITEEGSHTLRRIPKVGGAADTLVSGHEDIFGVAINGSDLYWSNADFAGDGTGTDGEWGGVWHCVLPECTTKTRVAPGDWATDVHYRNGQLFFAEKNGFKVSRVGTNGSGLTTLSEPNAIYLDVDDEHVYFTAGGSLKRVPVGSDGGGPEETVGAIEPGTQRGHVRLDADRVYWAYSGDGPPYDGYVQSQSKSNLNGAVISYGVGVSVDGGTNTGPVGVAVDDTNVYWTNGSNLDVGDMESVGTILTCPKTGCTGAPTVVASGLLAPWALAIDGNAIYVLSYGTKYGSANGAVLRVAKP